MKINVASSIAELLYEYNSVTIPGFGGLVASYKSADVAKVEGNIHPPSKEIKFNSNLLINDGLLVEHIRSRYQISFEEAEQEVDRFVSLLKNQLAETGKVEIPKVGKFSKSGNQYFFQAFSRNYNTDSFGLPTVNFFPVRKGGEEDVAFKPAPSDELVANPVAQKSNDRQSRLLAAAVLGFFFVTVIVVLLTLKDELFPRQEVVEDSTIFPSVPQGQGKKVNQSPSDNDLVIVIEEDKEKDPIDLNVDTESTTPPLGAKTRLVVVGIFSDEAYAKERIMQLQQAGYNPHRFNRKGRIGIAAKVVYQQEAELQAVFQEIRSDFDSNAWILPKEEE